MVSSIWDRGVWNRQTWSLIYSDNACVLLGLFCLAAALFLALHCSQIQRALTKLNHREIELMMMGKCSTLQSSSFLMIQCHERFCPQLAHCLVFTWTSHSSSEWEASFLRLPLRTPHPFLLDFAIHPCQQKCYTISELVAAFPHM